MPRPTDDCDGSYIGYFETPSDAFGNSYSTPTPRRPRHLNSRRTRTAAVARDWRLRSGVLAERTPGAITRNGVR